MAVPIRGIAALLKSLSKGGTGTARKPLLGKDALDRALTTRADFDSLIRAGGGENLPHRDDPRIRKLIKRGRANRNIPPEYYGRGGTQTTDAAQHGRPDRLAADRSDPFQINAKPVRSLPRITDEPPGLRRAGRRPSARERREERIAGVMRRKTPKERTDLEDWELERILAGDERAIERLMTHWSVRPPARRPGDV